MTALELLRSSFRLAGVLHEGQGPNADDITDGLFVWNAMLDAWNLERFYMYTVQRAEFALVAGQQVYTIGTGANFNVPRPIKIESAGSIVQGDGTLPYEKPIQMVTPEQWRDIQLKKIPSGMTDALWYQPALPNGLINLFPVPADSANKIALYCWTQLGQIANAGVTITFAPGYVDAMRYLLAMKLAPEWFKMPKQEVIAMAASTRAVVMEINRQMFEGMAAATLAPAA